MTKISATILTYNEERRIEACLESLRDIADEIIVVDSYSTDGTLDICRRYGCKITQRELSGFGAQRQYATSLTNNNYVISLDADEVISPALRQNIIRLKQEGLTHRVYAFSRLNFFCGFAVKHCGWYPDIQIRLFDKHYSNWNLRDVHERVIFRDSVRPQLIPGDILHYRCDTQQEYISKTMHLAELKSRVIAASDKPLYALTPTIKAAKAFINMYIFNGGIFDGSVGLTISRIYAKASAHVFRQALQLKKNTLKND